MYGYKNGYPVNAIWGYKYAGVWHNQAEIDRNNLTRTYVSHIKDGANGTNVGRAKFVDVNNDALLDLNDMVYLGTGDPIIYGGFQNDFTIYKNLNISFYFAYSLGGKMYNLSELYMGSTTTSYNKYRYILGAWDEELRPDSNIPKAGYNDTFASDRQVLCVTHSAQIAALADAHLYISKHEIDGRVETSVVPLDEDGRIGELSRIIGGIEITDAIRATAKELLVGGREL